MNPFGQFVDAWNDPAMRHAMVNHFPIVLSVIGIPFALLAALIGKRAKAMRWTALAFYVALMASAFVTKNSGDEAHDAIRGSLSDEAHEVLDEHEELGDKVWWFASAVALLLSVSFARNPKVHVPSAWVAVAGSLFLAGWVANAADHGGRLVYEHGAGTPDELAELFASADSPVEPTEDARVAFFRNQVRPILTTHCLRCHNPTRAKRSGGLDQSTIAGLLRGGLSGPALVPGRPDESLLILAVRHEDPDLQMPLGEDKLTDDLIAALEQWIADGAVWEPFEFARSRNPVPE